MKKSILLLSILFVFINIFSVLIYFSFNVNFYKNHFEPKQIENTNLVDLQNVYDFLQDKSDLNSHFTPLEIRHMQDVKNIFSVVLYVFYISLILFIFIALFLIYYHKYNIVFKGLLNGSIISLSIIGILLLVTIFDFNSSFQYFHKLFFPQGNREFAENSRLITLFPESFFIAISQNIFITISIVSIFIISVYLIIKKISHRKEI